jgi:hypothetical protein
MGVSFIEKCGTFKGEQNDKERNDSYICKGEPISNQQNMDMFISDLQESQMGSEEELHDKVNMLDEGIQETQIDNLLLNVNGRSRSRLTTLKKIKEQLKSISSDLQKESDLKVGFLQKKSPSFFKGWQQRFFILKDRKLKYYNAKVPVNSTKAIPKGVINFDYFTCSVKF